MNIALSTLNYNELLYIRDIVRGNLTTACKELTEIEGEIVKREELGNTEEDSSNPVPPPNAVWR